MLDRVDKELAPLLEAYINLSGGGISIDDIPLMRSKMAMMGQATAENAPRIEGIDIEDHQVSGYGDDPDILVRIYRPQGQTETIPGLLWIHGGGYVLGSVDQDDLRCLGLAKSINCVVASVEYRLAPETPHPGPLHDCYSALKWFKENALDLGVDEERIAIGGASAGGGLAAGLALFARDQNEVAVAYQLLIYPMIDDKNISQVDEGMEDTLVWSRGSNLIGWRSLLGQDPGGQDVSIYAAASRAQDLTGLPPTYICVGDIDLFAEEDIEYASRLIASGIPTELHVYPGGYHGFDGLAPEAALSRKFQSDLRTALSRALYPS